MSENNINLQLVKPKKHRFNRMKRNEAIWGYIFISPLVIGLTLFLAAPLFFSVYVSLTEYDLFNAPVFVGLDNFALIFSRDGREFWMAMTNALIMMLGLFGQIFLALLAANVLTKKIKFSNIFRSIFFIPTICSSVATSIMWKRMFDYQFGTLNQIITSLLPFTEKIFWLDPEHARWSIMGMIILFGFGTPMLLYISSIRSIPKTYYEAADIDGASTFRKFLSITIPQVSPITFYILVTGVIGTLQNFTVFQVMTNGNPPSTLMPVLLIYKYSGADYGMFYGLASAMAIVLGVIIALLTAINFIISRKWVHYES